MKKMYNLIIDSFDMPPILTQRTLRVTGDIDAEFSLQIFNSSNQFYNFNTRAFAAGSKSANTLNVKMKTDEFRTNIIFPANGSGTTYTILLLASEDKNTELDFGYGKHSFSTSITQNANAQLTFTVGTANSSTYTTFSQDITSSGAPNTSFNVRKRLDWTLSNTEDNTNGFGLRLIRQPIDTDWYYETTETVDGAVTSSTEIIVDDLTDLATGMHVTGISGGSSLSGTPTIIAINTSTKKLTLSSAQTFVDNTVLTFQARGSGVIKKSINADIDFSNFNSNFTSSVAAKLSKTVRTTATNETIPLNGTFGISGGGHVVVAGRGIVNTSANTVQSVDPGETDGSITMQVAQVVKVGTKLYFKGSTQSIQIKNSIVIRSYPSSNKTIKLNLDNFIQPGTQT